MNFDDWITRRLAEMLEREHKESPELSKADLEAIQKIIFVDFRAKKRLDRSKDE